MANSLLLENDGSISRWTLVSNTHTHMFLLAFFVRSLLSNNQLLVNWWLFGVFNPLVLRFENLRGYPISSNLFHKEDPRNPNYRAPLGGSSQVS